MLLLGCNVSPKGNYLKPNVNIIYLLVCNVGFYIYLFISVYFTLKSVDDVHMSTAQCKKGSRGP